MTKNNKKISSGKYTDWFSSFPAACVTQVIPYFFRPGIYSLLVSLLRSNKKNEFSCPYHTWNDNDFSQIIESNLKPNYSAA